MYLGDKIKKLRLEKKMSMRQLAEKLEVSHAHISKMENNQNKPSLDLLEKMAGIFNVHITYFFDNYEKQYLPPELADEGVEYIAIDKKYKESLTEDDLQNILDFVKDVKKGKFDLRKIEDIKFKE